MPYQYVREPLTAEEADQLANASETPTDVIDREGQIDRRYFELCTLWELRGALRAGNVWLENSRRFADPETYLIPREHWPQVRRDICRAVQLPEEGAIRLEQRRTALEEELALLDRDWPQ
jgi:hypothetical protein